VPAVTDTLIPFQLGAGAVRGRLVRLGPAFNSMIRGHAYPEPVAGLLGQAACLAAALAGALKFDGVFTVQAQGNGPISLLLADVTSTGHVRGYARFDADALASLDHSATADILLGQGHLAFTIDQGPDTDRYQGIVALTGQTLADSARLYFQQSEQLDTEVHLASAPGTDGQWRGAALMISRMPAATSGAPILTAEENQETWITTTMLLSTVTDRELLDDDLEPQKLLWRLFHQQGVHVHGAKPLEARCRCSRSRIEATLRSFPQAEIEELADESGQVVVTCEFCRSSYGFSPQDLSGVYRP